MPTDSSDDKFGTVLRELVTAILALTILVVTVMLLRRTFDIGGQSDALKDAFTREKDILQYGLSLLGAVIGYYFGRVPAELHAQAAQKQATNAQTQLNQTQDKLVDTARATAQAVEDKNSQAREFQHTLSVIRGNLVQPSNPPSQALRAQPQATGMAQALAEIDEMMVKLN